jgi:hypothetical protein
MTAPRDVFPKTREQGCWFHKMANVLRLPAQVSAAGAKAARGGASRLRPSRSPTPYGAQWSNVARQ